MQGYQNEDWHSDNPTHKAFLWGQRQFQDRANHLWEVIADRYKGNRWVAGYNLMNEPHDQDAEMFIPVTRRLYETVQRVDPGHLVFIDANKYSSDFSLFREPWPNVVYSFHDYALCGFVEGTGYPGYTNGIWCDRDWLAKHFLKKSAYAREHQVPMWVGEFGPVYTGEAECRPMHFLRCSCVSLIWRGADHHRHQCLSGLSRSQLRRREALRSRSALD